MLKFRLFSFLSRTQTRTETEPNLDPDCLYQDFCTGNATLDAVSDIPNNCSPLGDLTTTYLVSLWSKQKQKLQFLFFFFFQRRRDVHRALHTSGPLGIFTENWSICSDKIIYTPSGSSLVPLYKNFQKQKPGFKVRVLIYLFLFLNWVSRFSFILEQLILQLSPWRKEKYLCAFSFSHVICIFKYDQALPVPSQQQLYFFVAALLCQWQQCWTLGANSELHFCNCQGSRTWDASVSAFEVKRKCVSFCTPTLIFSRWITALITWFIASSLTAHWRMHRMLLVVAAFPCLREMCCVACWTESVIRESIKWGEGERKEKK